MIGISFACWKMPETLLSILNVGITPPVRSSNYENSQKHSNIILKLITKAVQDYWTTRSLIISIFNPTFQLDSKNRKVDNSPTVLLIIRRLLAYCIYIYEQRYPALLGTFRKSALRKGVFFFIYIEKGFL